MGDEPNKEEATTSDGLISDDEFEHLLDDMYGSGKFSEEATPIANLDKHADQEPAPAVAVETEEVVDMEAIQVVDLDQETILDLGQEKCIKQHVQNVVKNVKYHSNHQEKDLFIAKNVFKSVDQKGFDSYFF